MYDVYIAEGDMPGMADDPRGAGLRAVLSVIYTLTLASIEAG
jgi:hypothetical protein